MIPNKLTQISEHVYWLPPGEPDRPALGAVVGAESTLALDAGASAAHAQLFLAELTQHGINAPQFTALTHWHWDHVFGADALDAPVIAHAETAQQLTRMATYDWSDAGLETHIEAGEQTAAGAENIKQELPAPRDVRVRPASIVFHSTLELRLGGVTCQIQHVGGDHASDSSVMFIQPDGMLFIGDCVYDAIYAPKRHYTRRNLLPLLDTLLGFNAAHVIDGHGDAVLSGAEFTSIAEQMRVICQLVERLGDDETAIIQAIQAQASTAPDKDTLNFIRALIAGIDYE